MALLALLDRAAVHAAERPDEIAYREAAGGRSLSWRQLASLTGEFAQSIQSHLPSRGVVMLCAANQIEYPVAFLGILAAGCDVFPVSAEIAEAELLRAAEQSSAVALIGHDRACVAMRDRLVTVTIDRAMDTAAPHPNPLPKGEETRASLATPHEKSGTFLPLPPGEGRGEGHTGTGVPFHHQPALLLQSSGTTGLPKIVRRSGRSLDAVSAAMADACGFTPADHVLATVPLTHSYGLEHGLLAPVWAGSTVHLCRGLDVPTVLGELSREHITIFPAVPAVFEMLAGVSDAPAITSLRTAYSAGAPLPDSVTTRFAERFGVRITQLYGATEIGSVTFNSPRDEPFAPASVGKPMAGVEIRILDMTTGTPLAIDEEGHVAVRAASMFDGYLAAPGDGKTAFFEGPRHEDPRGRTVQVGADVASHQTSVHAELLDGFFPTGDLGRLDVTGRLFITGRIKLLIDVGGMKVNPFEVEAVLASHPQVGDCVVVAIRQSETVSRIKAVLTPRDLGSPPSIEALRAFAKLRLSAYKVPRVFEIRESLPRSAAGKVLRHMIESET